MNCYYHKDKDRAAECIQCGKPLCRACCAYWGANLCTHCIKKTAVKKRNIFILRLAAVILATTSLYYLFYCKIGGVPAARAFMPMLGDAESRKAAFFVYALACIPIGLRAALLLGRWFAEVYDLTGRGAVICFIAVLLAGILLGASAVPIYCIWLVYGAVKYGVTVKAAQTRLDKLSGKKIKGKRKK